MVDLEEFLEHHGVKGQRWGVRRKRSTFESKARTSRRKASKNRRTLSTEQLQKRVSRLELERKLKNLTEQDLSPGRSAAKKIMSESGQKIVKTAVSGAGVILVKTALTRKLSPKGTKHKMTLEKAKEIADTVARGGLKKK
jgi:hypothetical protein